MKTVAKRRFINVSTICLWNKLIKSSITEMKNNRHGILRWSNVLLENELVWIKRTSKFSSIMPPNIDWFTMLIMHYLMTTVRYATIRLVKERVKTIFLIWKGECSNLEWYISEKKEWTKTLSRCPRKIFGAWRPWLCT